jgi:hypothetical protein
MTDPERLDKIRTLLHVFLDPHSSGLSPSGKGDSAPNLSAAQQTAYDALCREAGSSMGDASGAAPEERIERMRELVRILLNCPRPPSDAIGTERRRSGNDEHRAAFEKLKEHLGVVAG